MSSEMAVDETIPDVADHSEGHFLEGEQEAGGSSHHRFLLVANDVVQTYFSLRHLPEEAVVQINGQIVHQDENLTTGSDDQFAEGKTSALRFELISSFLENGGSVHHKGVLTSAKVTPEEFRHEAQELVAIVVVHLAVQMATHGGEQVLGELHQLGAQREPVGVDQQVEGFNGVLLLKEQLSLQMGGQELHVLGQCSRCLKDNLAAVAVHSLKQSQMTGDVR
ncbi:hypothetical protein TYRP_018290 [Tyrophagus putrescentiae]|nr:hypothetical protein TYRP_018290 [Tyrophagus putrescentiae]